MPQGKKPSDPLNLRQLRFVEEYCIDFNATQAAIRAGYSPESAHSMGCRLLKHRKVARAIRNRLDVLSKKSMLTAERIQSELACMAFVNVVEVMTAEDLKKLPEATQRAITGIKFRREIKTEVRDGEEVQVPYEVVEVKFGKEGALRDAMRHLGMLVDRTKVEGELAVEPIRVIEVGESKREQGYV